MACGRWGFRHYRQSEVQKKRVAMSPSPTVAGVKHENKYLTFERWYKRHVCGRQSPSPRINLETATREVGPIFSPCLNQKVEYDEIG